MAKQETFTLNIGARTTAGYDRTIGKITKSLGGLSRTARLAGKLATATFASRQVLEWGKDAAETYKEFDSSMKNTAAIMNANVAEYERLEEAARKAGRTTTKTASQAADALGYMALAGWDVDKSVEGLMPILKLAEATQKDLKTTSDLVTDSMSALGVDVKDLWTYMDKLVATNNNANTSAEQLMYALVKTGGAARVMGMSMDDIIAATGVLANNGLKSSEAGTALNSILKRFASNKNAVDMLDAMNISLYDTEDNFRGFKAILKDINAYMADKGSADKNRIMSALGGRFYSQVEYLLASVRETGKDSVSTWDKLTGKIKNSKGALETMNKTATSSFDASQKLLKSAYEDLQITAVDVFSEDIKDAMRYLAGELPEISKMLEKFEEDHHDEIVEFLDGAAEALVTITEKGIQLADWAAKNGPLIIGVLGGIGSAAIVKDLANTATGIASIVTEAGGLAALLTNPATLAIGGAALAAGAIFGIAAAVEKNNKALERQSWADHFGDIALTATDIEEAARKILGNDSISRMEELNSQLSKAQGYLDTIETDAGELKRYNWKIEAGLELNENDKTGYQQATEGLIKNIQDYINSQHYTLSLSTDLIFGDGRTNADANKYWNEQSLRAEKLGKKLKKAMEKALEDGIIDPEKELPRIRKLQEELLKMQQEIEDAQYQAELDILKSDMGGEYDSESFKKIVDRTMELSSQRSESLRDAYKNNLATLNLMLKHGELTPSEHSAKKKSLESQYYTELAKSSAQPLETIMDTIKEKYGDEMATAITNATEKIKGIVDYTIESGDWEGLDERLNNITSALPEGVKRNLADVADMLAPVREELEKTKKQLEDSGREVPLYVDHTLETLTTLTGLPSERSMYATVADYIANNPDRRAAYNAAEEAGAGINNQLSDAMTNRSTISLKVQELYDMYQQELQNKFSRGITIAMPVSVKAKASGKFLPTGVSKEEAQKSGITVNAKGGIYDSPIVTMAAEEGPEAIIPLNRKQRSLDLLSKASRMMGATSNNNNVTYSPQYIIQGNASKQDIVEAQEMGLAKFRKLYSEMVRQDRRVAYAR